MYCQKCGKENMDDAKFCIHCGADLSGYKVEISPKIEVSPKISVSAKAEGYPRCPNCGNVLTDRNKIFSCQICGKKVCDTCGFHYNGLKLCERCKTKKEEERKKRQREEERKRREEERKRLERERHVQYQKEEEEKRQGYLITGLVFLITSFLPLCLGVLPPVCWKHSYFEPPDPLARIVETLMGILLMAIGLIFIYYSTKKQ